MIRTSLVLACALALGACSSLGGKAEPFTIYAPRYAAPQGAANATRAEWQLAIDTPLASDALDTTRMLVMPTPGAYETYKNARWADTTPLMLRGLVIQAFQDSGRLAGVGATTSGLHADFGLQTDLYDFETQYRDGAPHAVVRLHAQLTDFSLNRVAASRTFEADAPVAGASAQEAAAAFDAALNQMLPQLVDWTTSEGTKAWSKRP